MLDDPEFVYFYFRLNAYLQTAYPSRIHSRMSFLGVNWFAEMREWFANARIPCEMNVVVADRNDRLAEVIVTQKDALLFKLRWC